MHRRFRWRSGIDGAKVLADMLEGIDGWRVHSPEALSGIELTVPHEVKSSHKSGVALTIAGATLVPRVNEEANEYKGGTKRHFTEIGVDGLCDFDVIIKQNARLCTLR